MNTPHPMQHTRMPWFPRPYLSWPVFWMVFANVAAFVMIGMACWWNRGGSVVALALYVVFLCINLHALWKAWHTLAGMWHDWHDLRRVQLMAMELHEAFVEDQRVRQERRAVRTVLPMENRDADGPKQ